MRTGLRAHAIVLVLAAGLAPALAWGQQQRTLGPTLTQVVSSGDGVSRSCLQRDYSTGLGARFVAPLGGRTALHVVARGHDLSRRPSCVDGFPPPQGTFVEDDRVDLLSRSFVTTDVRFSVAPRGVGAFAIGVGNAWHEGYDLPYAVFSVWLPFRTGPGLQIALEGEYQWLRVSADRYRRTYENFQLIAEESLGRVGKWSHAVVLGLHLGFPL